MYRSGSDTGFYDKCSAVRALRVYLRPRFSLHRTENDNITLRPLKCRYHSDMEFSVNERWHLQVGGINRVGSNKRPSRRSSCESQMTGDEVSLRELTQGNEEKPRVVKMGKRNIKAQVIRRNCSFSENEFRKFWKISSWINFLQSNFLKIENHGILFFYATTFEVLVSFWESNL